MVTHKNVDWADVDARGLSSFDPGIRTLEIFISVHVADIEELHLCSLVARWHCVVQEK